MPRRLEGKTCALCKVNLSSSEGEQVMPAWRRRALDHLGALRCVRRWRAREEERDVRTHTAPAEVKVPACVVCNGALNERFEAPATKIGKALVAGRLSALHSDQADRWGLWASRHTCCSPTRRWTT